MKKKIIIIAVIVVALTVTGIVLGQTVFNSGNGSNEKYKKERLEKKRVPIERIEEEVSATSIDARLSPLGKEVVWLKHYLRQLKKESLQGDIWDLI